jgi:hypothetical protein
MTVESRKQFAIRAAKAAGNGAPDDAQLALVNGYTLTDHTAEQIYVRTIALAHNGIDRDREVIDEALLEQLAATLPGKGLFIKHPTGWDGDSGPGVGRFFATNVLSLSHDEARAMLREPGLQFPSGSAQARVLEASFYLVRDAAPDGLVANIDAGIVSDASIGFRHSDSQPIYDGDQQIARRLMAPGEAFEASLVWLGAQPGARIHKSAKPQGDDMTETVSKAVHDELTAQLKAANTRADTAEANAAKYTAAAKTLGEDFDAADLKARAEMGDAYKAGMIDDLVAAKRQLGMVGDTDADVQAAKDALGALPVTYLKGELKGALALAAGKQQLGGGDPNQPKSKQAGGLRDASVTKNAIGGGN